MKSLNFFELIFTVQAFHSWPVVCFLLLLSSWNTHFYWSTPIFWHTPIGVSGIALFIFRDLFIFRTGLVHSISYWVQSNIYIFSYFIGLPLIFGKTPSESMEMHFVSSGIVHFQGRVSPFLSNWVQSNFYIYLDQ